MGKKTDDKADAADLAPGDRVKNTDTGHKHHGKAGVVKRVTPGVPPAAVAPTATLYAVEFDDGHTADLTLEQLAPAPEPEKEEKTKKK